MNSISMWGNKEVSHAFVEVLEVTADNCIMACALNSPIAAVQSEISSHSSCLVAAALTAV
jgi:hypothetical protein